MKESRPPALDEAQSDRLRPSGKSLKVTIEDTSGTATSSCVGTSIRRMQSIGARDDADPAVAGVGSKP